jgi:hypothetical protein
MSSGSRTPIEDETARLRRPPVALALMSPKGEWEMSNDDLVAAFLAKGGKITRVSKSERTVSEREFYAARRQDRKAQSEEQRLIDERHEVIDHCGVSHFRNGLGEWIS